jgi:aminopeptidase N
MPSVLVARPQSAWHIVVADPGVEDLFGDQSYLRGAMTLQALRNVGDVDFFEIARRWAASQGGNGTTEEFMALAEQVSDEQLDDLFDVWIFTPEKPPASATRAGLSRTAQPSMQASASSDRWLDDVQRRLRIGRY